MSNVQASLVPTEFVDNVWPDVYGYMDNVAKRTHGRYEADDIKTLVTDYDHNLWIAFDESKILGAVVTCILHYPRKSFLSCPFVTGEDFSLWKKPMLDLLQKWAKDNDCDGLESTARIGWSKVFRDDGYKPLWQTFELPAAEAGLRRD